MESQGESTNDVNSGIMDVRIAQGPAPNGTSDGSFNFDLKTSGLYRRNGL